MTIKRWRLYKGERMWQREKEKMRVELLSSRTLFPVVRERFFKIWTFDAAAPSLSLFRHKVCTFWCRCSTLLSTTTPAAARTTTTTITRIGPDEFSCRKCFSRRFGISSPRLLLLPPHERERLVHPFTKNLSWEKYVIWENFWHSNNLSALMQMG